MKQLWKDKHGLTYASHGPENTEEAYSWALLELQGTMKLGDRISAADFNIKMEICLERLGVIKKIVARENEGLHSELTDLHQEPTDAD